MVTRRTVLPPDAASYTAMRPPRADARRRDLARLVAAFEVPDGG